MSRPAAVRVLNPRRLIGAVLFLAVLFLPLHFHFSTPAAQVAKECGCVYGSRIQAGLAPAQAILAFSLQASFIVALAFPLLALPSAEHRIIRSPPSACSS